jgi:hypothetical protein
MISYFFINIIKSVRRVIVIFRMGVESISNMQIHSWNVIQEFDKIMNLYMGVSNIEDYDLSGEHILPFFKKVDMIINNILNFVYYLLGKTNNIVKCSSPIQDDKINIINIQPKKYDEKYDEKYDLLEQREINEEDIKCLQNKIIIENTPNGNVIMFFDYDKKSFQYYSDFSIPYSFLESVSKKYCILQSNSIYRQIKMDASINDFSIIKNSTTALLQSKSKSFAKLKSYNNSSHNVGIPSNTKQQPTELKIVEKDIVRYTHLGKTTNFSFLKNEIPKHKHISYKDFVSTK